MRVPEFAAVEPEKLAHELSRRGLIWADANAAAELLEEVKKSLLSKVKLGCEGKSMDERETKALASDEYMKHLNVMVAARRDANIARVRYDVYKTYVELTRSRIATERAAMGMR